MSRTDDDSWDLASSVGATATMVAAGRAMATKDPKGLINDPYADPLVRAVGLDFFTKMMDGELDFSLLPNSSPDRTQAIVDGMGIRTKYFDEYLLAAVQAGVRQVVILASGLDSRAYRLPWPAGTTVYEIDQPAVIEFKTTTLADLGAAPKADRRSVAVDLRHDWPAALRGAGLDPTQPTAWSAEGLMPFLPPEAQDALLDNITMLSAAGSQLATESGPDASQAVPRMADRMRQATERWRDHGFDVEMTDLWYGGDRNDVVDYLGGHGWNVSAGRAAGFVASPGLSVTTPGENEPKKVAAR